MRCREGLAGDLDAAERELREAIRLAAEMGSGRYVGIHRAGADVLVDLAEVLRESGDFEGAATALEEAVALHEEKGNVINARRCRELLAAIGARPS